MTNSLKISLENFQSHTKSELEFKKGITLLVGSSNSGKSSVMRAIKAVLNNTTGAQRYIKNGADSTKVRLQYLGNDIEWIRHPKEAKYLVNGENYSKVGNSNCFKIVSNNLGFITDEKNNILNIEGEWDMLFPFQYNEVDLFKLFENVFCTVNSTEIFKSFKAEEDSINKELQIILVDITKTKSKIKAIEELQAKVDLEALRAMKTSLTSLTLKHNQLQEDITFLKKIFTYIDLSKKCLITKQFTSECINKYKTITLDIEQIKKVLGFLKLSKKLVTKQFTSEGINEYKVLKTDILFIKKIQALPVPPKTKVFSNNNIEEYKQLKQDIKRIDTALKINKALKSVDTKQFMCNNIEEYKQLKQDILHLKNLESKRILLEKENIALDEVILECKEILSEFDTCPLCSQSIGENIWKH